MANNELSLYDDRGFFYGWTSRPDAEVGDVLMDDNAVGCVEGRQDGAEVWWDGSQVALRPTLAVDPQYFLSVGDTLVIPGLPIGTIVTMNGMLLGVTEQPEEPLLFEEEGSNVLTLEPFPFKVTQVLVNVS